MLVPLTSASEPGSRSPGDLPAGVSVTCADPGTYGAVARYLRSLAPGLAHLGPQPVRFALHAVPAEEVPRLAPRVPPYPRRGGYRVAWLGDELVYGVDGRGLLRLDRDAATAAIWTTRTEPAGAGLVIELVSIALTELASHRGLFGLHAGALARDGVGYLLPGASGSGKTSLCLALVREGFGYLTDDFVLLTGDPDDVRCLALFRTFNLDVGWADRFPELGFMRDLPPLGHKRVVDPERCYPGSRLEASRPQVLLFPTIVASARSAVRPIPPGDAFRRLLPGSHFSGDARVAERHVRLLEGLVRQATAFEVDHGRDFLAAPGETLRRLLASCPHDAVVGSP